MPAVVVFHHVLGLTDGVVWFADRLRDAGYDVSTPDLFDGRRFDSLDAGAEHAEAIGFETIAARGAASAEPVPAEGLVAVGFSLGVLPAQQLAQTVSGVWGAVLCHSAVPSAVFGDRWPADVALQLHLSEDDPIAEEDLPAARELAGEAGGELFLYPGSGHLVADPTSPDHDPELADAIVARTIEFVGRFD